MSDIEVYAGAAAIAEVASEWEALAERSDAWPCQRPGWLRAWQAAFGRGQLRVLVVHSGGTLGGVVPLLRGPGGLRSPTNWHSARFGVVAAGSEEREALADGIVGHSVPVRLSYVHRNDPTAGEVRRAAKAAGSRVLTRELPSSPYLRTSGTRDSWWERLSGHMRRELRRRRRKLERQGQVSLEIEEDTGPGDALLAEGLGIEGSGWKDRRGTAIRSTAQTLEFYTRIARWAQAQGQLRLAFLRLDGRPIAFDLSLEDRRRHYLLKTGFDPAFAPFSPGQQLRLEMIDRAFANRLDTYEFLGAAEPWKLEWTDATRPREQLVIVPPTVRGAIAGAVHGRLLPLARRARAALRPT